MLTLKRLGWIAGRTDNLVPYLSALYAALGLAFLAVSPAVGAVLLTVGIATFGMFVGVERLTRRAPVGRCVPQGRRGWIRPSLRGR
jgi:hypothetical protein